MPQEEGHVGPQPGDEAASRGGCLNFGWGCLPVLIGFALLVPGLGWLA